MLVRGVVRARRRRRARKHAVTGAAAADAAYATANAASPGGAQVTDERGLEHCGRPGQCGPSVATHTK